MNNSEEKYKIIREFIETEGENIDLHHLCEILVDLYEIVEKNQKDIIRIKFDLP